LKVILSFNSFYRLLNDDIQTPVMSHTLGLETRVWGKGAKGSQYAASVAKMQTDYWFNTVDLLVECYLSKR
jgi:hypothetical protein